ncbi:L-aspartate oxidase [Microbacterium marinilacus]|uniref:L-aspartate oxidase n=1 Tax=Microbacterium marinilacus TaxID=415209 RepID=A0ABP7B8C4_9MICO|nr:L-aspartate oxidase [Microbacterium marinilacus]MBY0687475.1 L-aspartate oxidase [Microbacterium marinilacus]
MPHAIVVGTGIAGLTCALHAASRGVDVTLVTKDAADHGATRLAQGGIAGVVFPEDRIKDHVRDTLIAGAGLCDEAAVRAVVTEGPHRIDELARRGVAFDRDGSGRLRRGLEAAHSFPRILHAGGDATGLAIETALLRATRQTGIRIVEHALLMDLLTRDGAVTGVRLFIGGRPAELRADAVVLATGGAGQLYSRTTNPAVATADGIGAALRAGAEARDLEFVQFHPTVLLGGRRLPASGAGDAFLVSEAVRGEGATLIDEDGRRFVFDAHPDGELAPRDVVARAIAARMNAQRGRPVRLDATSVRGLTERFPSIDAAVRERGLDWTREPIPVTPAAHYLMGGVRTDLRGRTTLPGLYAVGETACTGVHGANRLASNSLLEAAVFGARAAADIADGGGAHPVAVSAPRPAVTESARGGGDPATSAEPFSRPALQRVMWRHVGLTRDGDGLARAARAISVWRRSASPAGTPAEHEDANLLLVAEAVVTAASARRRSVGAHFRSDDPAPPELPSSSPAREALVPSGAPC